MKHRVKPPVQRPIQRPVQRPVRRRYDSTVRSQRAAETSRQILDAACELLRASAVRDWQALTIRAVAERAGVNERTVYRHFGNERGLRDAVMHRLEEQAGIDLSALELGDVVDVTQRIFESVASHPIEPRSTLDPTLNHAASRQRQALLRAVTAHTDGWSDDDRQVAAAMFDALWGVANYERAVVAWQLDPDRAVAGIMWVIKLIETAVRQGHRPSDERAVRRR